MAKKSSRNDDFLFSCKYTIISPKLYSVIADLYNSGKEKEAKIVANLDYLLDYLATSIKARDRFSTIETSNRIKEQFQTLENLDVEIPMLKDAFEKVMKNNKLKL
ncbi:MAG: hypothetical protein ACRC41_05600 [Sarcina sp.]